MPLSRPQTSAPPQLSPSSSADRPAAGRPGLRILVAGVDRDARAPVEAAVKRAFAGRAAEPWSVSLVRLGTLWSVTLNGPSASFHNLSFTAEERRLAEAIAEAIRGEADQPGPARASAAAPPARAVVQERHACGRCRQAILVTYEAQPNEAKQLAPLACPHCWTVGQVEIGGWAAAGGDYRAEKA